MRSMKPRLWPNCWTDVLCATVGCCVFSYAQQQDPVAPGGDNASLTLESSQHQHHYGRRSRHRWQSCQNSAHRGMHVSRHPVDDRDQQRTPSTDSADFSWVTMLLPFTTADRTFLEGATRQQWPSFLSRKSSTKDDPPEYDYVIVGNGIAGSACYKKLRSLCPSAKIAILDPLQPPMLQKGMQALSSGIAPMDDKTHYFPIHATRIDPERRVVGWTHSDAKELRYRCALLLATGSRGAPPPRYLYDESIRDAILEFRPTLVHPPDYCCGSQSNNTHTTELVSHRPVVSMETVQKKVMQEIQKNRDVAILGSGWDAIDLVAAAALQKKRRHHIHLFFGNNVPLSSALPHYLGSAVTKRLKSKRIHVHHHSVIRYISGYTYQPKYTDQVEEQPHGRKNPRSQPIRIYTARRNDFLDTNITNVDLVVVAPEVAGSSGSATLPTTDFPSNLATEALQQGRAWYQTWANVSRKSVHDPALIACYNDDGRIVVNAELLACTGIYAAGSVAKYANGVTGHADVAGIGVEDAVDAGEVAACNMARHFYEHDAKYMTQCRFTKDPVPVWRSDIAFIDGVAAPRSLSRVGIHALCIGHCDSDRFHTHAYWWTNQSVQQRMLRLLENESKETISDVPRDSIAISEEKKQLRLRRMTGSDASSIALSRPVYGIGVVFYLDRTGKIHGIMTWGLPFAMGSKTNELNKPLVDHLKSIIATNGGLSFLETESDLYRMLKYLKEESRLIVAEAYSGCANHPEVLQHFNGNPTAWKEFPQPLYRATEVRSADLRSLGVVKRRDGQGRGILGQDIFERYTYGASDSVAPVSDNGETWAVLNPAETDWKLWESREKQWDENEERARPPKEEPLWIRKGDDMKNISQLDRLDMAYQAAMRGSVGARSS